MDVISFKRITRSIIKIFLSKVSDNEMKTNTTTLSEQLQNRKNRGNIDTHILSRSLFWLGIAASITCGQTHS